MMLTASQTMFPRRRGRCAVVPVALKVTLLLNEVIMGYLLPYTGVDVAGFF